MKTTKEKMEVMQAFMDGKLIQRTHRDEDRGRWSTLGTEPVWDWLMYDFRVKPELRTIWVNEYASEQDVVHDNKEIAIEDAAGYAVRVAVEYREVIGEE